MKSFFKIFLFIYFFKGYFEKQGVLMCEKCSYTCYQCSGTGLSDCTDCNSVISHRTLISGRCDCQTNYSDNGSQVCTQCHYSCASCY